MGVEQQIAEAEGPVRHKITVEEFLILDEAGAFGDDHVELIDGEIFVLSPIHVPHSETQAELLFCVMQAVKRYGRGLRGLSPVSSHLDDYNLPEPDILIVESPGRKFVAPGEMRIAIEVAYSSLQHDLVKKAGLYARTGVPEYWVADVKGRRIIRMHAPIEGAYTERAEFAFGATIDSATIDGLVVDTAELGIDREPAA